ncbi:MAG: hypothetical protein JWO72_2819 [Caulobacteraceae bacterium]|nr:hypothetical protein [Caulobacteraceae bacterium]
MVHRLLTAAAAAAAALGVSGAAHAQGKAPPATDLSGVYFNEHPAKALTTVDGSPILLTAAGKAALAANAAKAASSKIPPAGFNMDACLPFGPTRMLQQPYPLEVVQKGDTVVLIWERSHAWERVYMNEKPNPDADPTYMGYAVGHWDGPTLVVDTSLFNNGALMDDNGLPHSDSLQMERRLRKVQGGKALEIVATVTDPVMYIKPWTVRAVLPLRPDIKIEEFVCGLKTFETRYTRAGR